MQESKEISLNNRQYSVYNEECVKLNENKITGSIYRRGARRWRKLYKMNGHTFHAKRFNRVSEFVVVLSVA